MKQGDVVLTPIAQADGKVKQRPVIILREMPSFQDLLVWCQHLTSSTGKKI